MRSVLRVKGSFEIHILSRPPKKKEKKKVRSSRARVKVSILNNTDVIAVNQSL